MITQYLNYLNINGKSPLQKNTNIVVKYQVYAFELTVRTSYLDNLYGLLTPASIFFYISDNNNKIDNKANQIEIEISIQKNWKIFCTLNYTNSKYMATNYDELIDSPIGLAHENGYELLEYEIDKIPCEVVLIGVKGNQNIGKFKDDLIKIQKYSIELFGELPYDRYLWALYVVGKEEGVWNIKVISLLLIDGLSIMMRISIMN